MILADKIIRLRKKNGWSQEELASDDDSSDTTVKKISIEEANTYLEQRKLASWRIALATFLCILSPITLIVLITLSELPNPIITETAAGAVGLVVLFAFILCAVPIYIYCGFKDEPYAFLDKNIPFGLEYGVKGMVTERKKKFRDTYIKFNIIAACICIFSPIPLIISDFTENELLVIMMLALLMIVAGIGASIFIVVGVQNASMQKLLKEGEFTEKEKKRTSVKEAVGFVYWGVLTAIYLTVSFLTNYWHLSWLVFAIGGVLFPIVMMLCNLIADKDKKN